MVDALLGLRPLRPSVAEPPLFSTKHAEKGELLKAGAGASRMEMEGLTLCGRATESASQSNTLATRDEGK